MSNKKAALELGTRPVSQLLVQYALPAIVAMVATSLYNVVDSIFIGQGVGALAIAGLAITFPFMNLSAAFGAAIGVGASTLLSVKLGQRDYDIANRILGNNVLLNIIVGVLFAAVSLFWLDGILRFFGASDATLPYAHDYMVIILLGNAVTHLHLGLNAMLRAAGKASASHVSYHRNGNHQCHSRSSVYLHIRDGHTRCCCCYYPFTGIGIGMPMLDVQPEDRTGTLREFQVSS